MQANFRALACCLFALLAPVSELRADFMFVNTVGLQPTLVVIDPTTGYGVAGWPITGSEVLLGGLTVDKTYLYSIDGYNDAFPEGLEYGIGP